MTWLAAALLVGALSGWWSAGSVSGPLAVVLSFVVLALVLGLLPLGALGRRVLWRAGD